MELKPQITTALITHSDPYISMEIMCSCDEMKAKNMAGFFLCQYKNISESLAVESSRKYSPWWHCGVSRTQNVAVDARRRN